MTYPERIFEDLLIVVVLFGRSLEESQAVMSLREALAGLPTSPKIFIYDNSPLGTEVDSSMIYVHDPANGGVSKAYNQAAVFAHSAHKKWMLLLDQDTTVVPGLFEAWHAALIRHPGSVAFVPKMRDAVGAVSPFALFMGGGRRIKTVSEKLPLARYRFINSGLFVQCEAFTKVGGYNEKIPLDFSDVSFGHRLSKLTDHFAVIDFQLPHRLSGADNPELSESLVRFGSFCKGATMMGRTLNLRFVYVFRVFARAFHLAVRYSTISFLKVALREAYHR